MKKYYFKKETIGSEKIFDSLYFSDNPYNRRNNDGSKQISAAIDPQIISEAMQNQKIRWRILFYRL